MIQYEKIIFKYLQGNTTEKEDFLLKEWINKSDKNKKEFDELTSIWKKTEHLEVPPQNDPELIWRNIQRDINRKVVYKETEFDYSVIIKAAAFILVAVTSILLYNNLRNDLNQVKTNNEVAVVQPTPVAHNTLITYNGQRSTCVLPDSTVVHLNSESSLTYPVSFSDEKRIVTLNGEAYFSVRPDKNRPFIVKTGNSQITVTGTEFNVRNRNKKVNVVVTRGTVNVLSLSSLKEEKLKSGEMAQLDNSGNLSEPVHVNLKYYMAWRENKLAFRHSTLAEVMSEIKRTFNVDVEYASNKVKSRTITGIFETDSLEKIISVLSVTLDLDISQKGTKIIIK